MKNSNPENTLRQLREIVKHDTGTDLSGEAVRMIQDIVAGLIGDADAYGEAFSRRDVTIMLTDLRGFTAVSESFPAGMVIEQLNRYLTKMSEIIVRNHGTIDKFMGDAIMVVFGAPYPQRDHVTNAVRCAVEMQMAMDEVNADNKLLGMPELFMGIGINTGSVMAGLLGSDLHSEYTVIGDEVNLASRIEAFSLRGQILISEATLNLCGDFVRAGEPMDVLVKGKANPVNLFEVLAIPSLGMDIPRRENRRSPRVRVNIPFTYQFVVKKIVEPQIHEGTIMDISYHGILAETNVKPERHSEIKMMLDLSLVGYTDANVYAKIQSVRRKDGFFMAGLEFTSVSVHGEINIKRFVQLLIQGREIS